MSKNIDFNLYKELERFGLSQKDSLVYMALLQSGEVSAIELSKTLNLHRQFVYNALHALKERGLVIQIGEKRAKWRVLNPRKFIALAEEQTIHASRLSEQLMTLMGHKGGQEFEVTEGNAAFRIRSVESVRKAPHGSVILMICGQWKKYFEQIGEEGHSHWERVRLVKGIHFRIIGPKSFETAMSEESSGRLLTEYRIFPGLEENLVNTVIFDDHIDYEIYGEPHVTFSIKNPEVAGSQKKFFEALWEKSEIL